MPRAVIYVRVSSDEQVKGMSLDFQKVDCSAYAERKGLIIDRIFEERGESAKVTNRPELINLLEHCRKKGNRIDAMIVWKLDRLSRNQLDYYYLKRTLLDHGVSIHSATEPSVDETHSLAGKVFETFSALQAEIENTIKSERTRRGMEAKINSGISPFRPPVGYRSRRDKLNGRKKTQPDEPDPVIFPIVQAALRKYARGGFSQKDLAQLLDEQGLAQARGKKTHPQLVMRFLRDYLNFYAGFLTNPWSRERVRGAHTPMLTEQEALRIAAIRDGRSIGASVKKRKVHPLFPLRRTIRCAACGQFFTASVSRGNGGRFAYYHCPTKGCVAYGKSVSKQTVEDEFEALASRHAIKTRFLPVLKTCLEKACGENGREARAKQEISHARLEALEKKKRRIFDMREEGAYTQDEFMERKAMAEAEIGEVKLSLHESAPEVVDLNALFSHAARFVEELGTSWRDLSVDLQQRFQKLLLPDGISYCPKKGFGTPILGLIFRLNQEYSGEKSRIVTQTGDSWNQIINDLEQMIRNFD